LRTAVILIVLCIVIPVKVSAYGDSLEYYLRNGGYYLGINDFEKSMELYSKALKFDSTSVNALMNIGVIHGGDKVNMVCDFCESEGIEYVDLRKKFLGLKDEELWVHPMDQHPNHIGHRLIAEGVFEALAR